MFTFMKWPSVHKVWVNLHQFFMILTPVCLVLDSNGCDSFIRQCLVQPRAWSISTYNQKKINRNSFKLFSDTFRPKTKTRARSSAQQKCCAWGLGKNVIQIRRKWAKTGLCDNNPQCYVPIFIVNCFYYFQLAEEKFPVLQDWHKLICLKS